jgi:hypothetical protein
VNAASLGYSSALAPAAVRLGPRNLNGDDASCEQTPHAVVCLPPIPLSKESFNEVFSDAGPAQRTIPARPAFSKT